MLALGFAACLLDFELAALLAEISQVLPRVPQGIVRLRATHTRRVELLLHFGAALFEAELLRSERFDPRLMLGDLRFEFGLLVAEGIMLQHEPCAPGGKLLKLMVDACR